MVSLSSRLSGIAVILLLLSGTGCLEDQGADVSENGETSDAPVSAVESKNDLGMIMIDGSSTVHPISEAVAAAFGQNVNVAAPSGTTSGFDKFIGGEIDINNASRPIKDSETERCKDSGLDWLELTVAIDGISVVVNKENTWCDSLTYAQLSALWEEDSKVKTWKDLNPEWPDETIKLYGPDDKSGTFEYFTGKVVGTKNRCRQDYEPSTDDNVLVTGVSGDKYAIGYFGYGYYVKSRKVLKGLSIAKQGEPVAPTVNSIRSYEYPIARPIFIYVNKARLGDKGMGEFLRFYLKEGQKVVPRVGCVQLPEDKLAESVAALEAALSESK
ncbi:MAG: PstS family phosphate ABC transporter substrate-binding protein [Planctomycetaceae bacterium]